MPALRVILLWHQHQPFYKDLVTGEYRLPWVRLHALKDYFGMVKLLEEFPHVHQNFNLVPSLMVQIGDYVAGTARDPFLSVAAKPARELSTGERRFALQYLFQANPQNLIGRYPRYRELWERFREHGDHPERAERYFQVQDFTDLQVLSQLAWFDEFFLEEKDVAELVRKGHSYSLDDQKFVIAKERQLIGRVLPAHAAAAKKGSIEISATPFYHPILPLVCDTNMGAASSPGLPLPQSRFRHPEDARDQLVRGLDLHEQVFGVRPKGVWPSEGSLSEEVLAIAHSLGVEWMATDEGILGRSSGLFFARDGNGRLPAHLAERLYNIHRYENGTTQMHLVFRDHTISDLIGFVYSGMPPAEAAKHLVNNIKEAARPVLARGRDAVVSIILDGENAWEYYPKSGREFLRRFYDGLEQEPGLEALTISESIARHKDFGRLDSLTPGSWINANFNVWIGAPEDNRAWDYLNHAREFYAQNAARATESQRKLAFDEILIAEGSDWNWWYGPEHHTANDRDFDELYRKHLSNVYQALGGVPPDYLAQPIAGIVGRPSFVRQTAYIHPQLSIPYARYFDWIGAAMYTADRRAGAMHGKQFLLDAVHAGIDESNVYGRVDLAEDFPAAPIQIVVNCQAENKACSEPGEVRIEVDIDGGKVIGWKLRSPVRTPADATKSPHPGGPHRDTTVAGSDQRRHRGVDLRIRHRTFEFKLPLDAIGAKIGSKLRLKVSVWRERLPIDALPIEDWIELAVVPEDLLQDAVYNYGVEN